LANPSNYPDVLVIANHVNYLSDASWNAVRRYLDAGGDVFYTQDNSIDKYTDGFLSNSQVYSELSVFDIFII
jgi:hypothetical protein